LIRSFLERSNPQDGRQIQSRQGGQGRCIPPGLLVINLTTSTPLPATLNSSNLNEFLVPLLDPTVEQLSSLYQIWFSDANTLRFSIEDRFDALAAGSSGFVSNVTYAAPPPTGKEAMEGKGTTGGKQVTSVLQPSPENRWGVWVTGYGDFVNVEDDGSAKGYDFTTGGLTIGIDYRVTHNFVMGLMGGYSHSWTNLIPAGSIDVDSGWGGIYYGYFNHGFYANGAVYGGHYTFESARTSLLGMANGSSGGGELSTYLASGYDFHLGHLRIGPLATLQYAVASLNGFTERGSLAPLKVNSDSQDSLVTDVGFRAADSLPAGKIILNPFVRVAWEHEYKYSSLPISAGLTDVSGSSAMIMGPSLGHDSAVINAGLTVQWSQRLSTYVSYDGQLGRSRYNSNGVSGGFRYAF
jgi:outer membrane autotransporter protein